MKHIRQAVPDDAIRIAEIEISNYRLNFYPIFRNDFFYFVELQVPSLAEQYLQDPAALERTFVYDDGVVKGFVRINGREIEKLFVEPVLQRNGIGAELLTHAVSEKNANHLWALEKNTDALRFYQRHGFRPTGERKPEEDTEEYLVHLKR